MTSAITAGRLAAPTRKDPPVAQTSTAQIEIDNAAAYAKLLELVNNNLAEHDFNFYNDDLEVQILANGGSRVRVTLGFVLDKRQTDQVVGIARIE
jgi:hypothetical protein